MRKITLTFFFALTFISQIATAGTVARSQFTSSVISREPIDSLQTVPVGLQKVTFFSELNNFENEKVTHQWLWHDKEMYAITFKVKGPRWRVWSSKRLMPKWHGLWTVNITNEQGDILKTQSFNY